MCILCFRRKCQVLFPKSDAVCSQQSTAGFPGTLSAPGCCCLMFEILAYLHSENQYFIVAFIYIFLTSEHLLTLFWPLLHRCLWGGSPSGSQGIPRQ